MKTTYMVCYQVEVEAETLLEAAQIVDETVKSMGLLTCAVFKDGHFQAQVDLTQQPPEVTQ